MLTGLANSTDDPSRAASSDLWSQLLRRGVTGRIFTTTELGSLIGHDLAIAIPLSVALSTSNSGGRGRPCRPSTMFSSSCSRRFRTVAVVQVGCCR